MAVTDFTKLKRTRYPMPGFVKEALEASGLREAYDGRPAYQQNDYVGWISRAKQEQTQQKRLAQMLAELQGGKLYMKMKYTPKMSPQSPRRRGKMA